MLTVKSQNSFFQQRCNLIFDYQTCAMAFRYSINVDGKTLDSKYEKTTTDFDELKLSHEKLKDKIDKRYYLY